MIRQIALVDEATDLIHSTELFVKMAVNMTGKAAELAFAMYEDSVNAAENYCRGFRANDEEESKKLERATFMPLARILNCCDKLETLGEAEKRAAEQIRKDCNAFVDLAVAVHAAKLDSKIKNA